MPAGTMKLSCSVCGSVNKRGRHGAQCDHGCFLISRFLEWNGSQKRLRILRAELVPFLSHYRTWDELNSFVHRIA